MTAIIARTPASAKSAPLAAQQPAPALSEPLMPERGTAADDTHQPHASYSHAQLVSLLEVIAENMHTLTSILRMAQTCQGDWERSNLIDAAQAMAQSIGCIADQFSEASVLGDIGRWHCGPSFHDLGAQA